MNGSHGSRLMIIILMEPTSSRSTGASYEHYYVLGTVP